MNQRANNLGITVVELLVVMGVIAAIMTMAVIGMSALGSGDLRGDAQRLTSVMKYTYSSAAINNSRYRLVIDIDNNKYWTEVAKRALVPSSQPVGNADEFLTEEAQALAEQQEEEDDLFDSDEQNSLGVNRKITYEQVDDAVTEMTSLKNGVTFDKVVTSTNPDPYTEGQVAVTFFSNGFQEPVMIFLKDESGGVFTLVSEPMTGVVRTYSSEREIPDEFGEGESDD